MRQPEVEVPSERPRAFCTGARTEATISSNLEDLGGADLALQHRQVVGREAVRRRTPGEFDQQRDRLTIDRSLFARILP